MAARFAVFRLCWNVFCLFIVLVLKAKGSEGDLSSWEGKTYGQLHKADVRSYSLPDLPYEGGYGGLEPIIDEPTLRVHHTGHHKTYTDNTNSLLSSWRSSVSIEHT